jgi:hypothetical protein
MSKKVYTDYPEQYFQLLEDISKSHEDFILEGPFEELVYLRHDLHRFFHVLSAASRQKDKYAAQLFEISRDLIISLKDNSPKECKIVIRINPLVKGIIKYRS